MTTSSLQSQPHRTPKRRHGRRRRNPAAAILALTLATALSLTGCTPKDSPPNAGTAPPTAPAPTTAPTTAPAIAAPTTPPAALVYKPATADGPAQNVPVPVLPAKAKEFSKTGLEEFARYWYSTLGYAYETGDTDPMMAITEASCVSCKNVRETVMDAYDAGGWIVGGQMVVHSSSSTFHETPDSSFQAIVVIQQKAVSSYKSDGSLETALTAKIARPDIVIAAYKNGKWTAQTAEHLTKN